MTDIKTERPPAAPTVGSLAAARVLQAVGAALLTPASLALVLGAFPASKRAVAVSLWGAVGGLAAALGPSVGAAVVDTMGWRWAFFLNLPLGLIAWWRGRGRLTEWRNAKGDASLDGVGIGLLNAGPGIHKRARHAPSGRAKQSKTATQESRWIDSTR